MSLLSTTGLSKSFGAEDIFADISISVPKRARAGLVGPNGVGKTTLLRILYGLEEPTSGQVRRARGTTIGYLPQEASLHSANTLWEECLSVFDALRSRQRELARLEAGMADPQKRTDVLETYGHLQAEFEHLGGYTFETHILRTLTGLGFSPEDTRRPVLQLSGGQRTRASLARLLLQNPDVLLLDEPTNHLDIAAIEWLEAFLREWPGAAVIVSHDRYFLDQVVDTIWEMTPALETYRGNYSAYMQQRGARYQRQLEEFQAQQEFIEKEEEYIRRNIAGQNSRQAQGRRKRLERMLEEARLTPPSTHRRLHIKLETEARSGDLVLRTTGLSVGYADEGKPLFQSPDIVFQRGECAAILGPNGAGKTTFLKTILAQTPPFAGEVELGANLKIGYFAQAHDGLHPEKTLMEEIEAAAPAMLPHQIRDYLARFLFSGDDVFKTVEVLSGGERGRLALACLALQGANLLLLDEPTNHLDLSSQETLQAILQSFNGTILLVSHDRYLIDALASQIWEVLPVEAELRIFEGSYSGYKASLQSQASPRVEPAAAPPAVLKTSQETAPTRLSKHEQRRRQQRQDALEQEISALESRLNAVTRQLENPPADSARVQKLGQEYMGLQSELEAHLQEWEALFSSENV
ncbi:MAG: ABC-F family ATP-binding cassette domain-containing protein [Anaerolineaceae bacterium]|nr:ABC-F family ATP-binding cassette domain-containing protein [Anaerolineaceae bacterium]